MNRLRVTFYLVCNLIFSISIILLNKWIYSNNIFSNIALSMVHFVMTFFGLYMYERLNYFNVKSVHLNQLIVLALCFCGFVVFTNLSLEYNTVGTFQVAKMLTTPGVVALQIILLKRKFTWIVKLSMVCICNKCCFFNYCSSVCRCLLL